MIEVTLRSETKSTHVSDRNSYNYRIYSYLVNFLIIIHTKLYVLDTSGVLN